MTHAALRAEAALAGLTLRGGFHPGADDGAPEGCGTLLLLGPDEPRFWDIFRAAPEYRSGKADPLDRWSKRVIGALAEAWRGTAVFPSDGPPYPPFLNWAQKAGTHASPVGLLVHPEAGLFVSFRGAVAVPGRIALPDPAPHPCPACDGQPCATACPVGAMRPGADYDVAACQAYLRRPEGADCRTRGCLVRRACPLSRRMARPAEQSAFHMAAFLKD